MELLWAVGRAGPAAHCSCCHVAGTNSDAMGPGHVQPPCAEHNGHTAGVAQHSALRCTKGRCGSTEPSAQHKAQGRGGAGTGGGFGCQPSIRQGRVQLWGCCWVTWCTVRSSSSGWWHGGARRRRWMVSMGQSVGWRSVGWQSAARGRAATSPAALGATRAGSGKAGTHEPPHVPTLPHMSPSSHGTAPAAPHGPAAPWCHRGPSHRCWLR